MQRQNVEFVVQVGLGVILVILFLLAIAGMYQIRETNQSMSNVVHENQLKVKLAHEMRDAIRLREIALNKMLASKDPFERDDELIRFYEFAGIYRHARSELVELPMDAKEKEIQQKLNKVILKSQPLNRKAAELIADDSSPDLIIEAVTLASNQQRILLNLLNQLVEIQVQRAREAVHIGTSKYDRSLFVVIMVGVIIIIGALFIVRKVSKYVAGKNQELMQKNEQLAQASSEALSANKTKSAFLATMSHEIRTPLTAIIGFAEASLDSDQTIEQRICATKTIIQSGKHLLQIINDILDLSKIEANKLDVEGLEFSPFELLADVEAIAKPLADAKNLTFKIDYELPIPKIIVSDPLRLKQILINLISNAIKFTDTGHVLVAVKFNPKQKSISFNVIDSGIGMTEEQMLKIFDSFTQADSSTTRKYGGTGLGLSLSKELAQQLGGDISVKSLKNTGSQFELIVDAGDIEFNCIHDVKDIPIPEKLDEPEIKFDKLKGSILLAEDNENNQRLLTHILNKFGASVDIAKNGEIAVSMAGAKTYDLILMDMQMPILGGLEAVKKLKSSGYKKPIVALTANAMKKDKDDCFNAGCEGFLTKPIDRKELYAVVESYLQKDTEANTVQCQITSILLEDEPELADLVEKYCSELPDIYQHIKMLSQEQNWSELTNTVHQLKGTGGGMGFPVLTKIAGKLQFQIANEDYQSVGNLIDELGTIINRITMPFNITNIGTDKIKLVN